MDHISDISAFFGKHMFFLMSFLAMLEVLDCCLKRNFGICRFINIAGRDAAPAQDL